MKTTTGRDGYARPIMEGEEGVCSTAKVRYPTEVIAEQALERLTEIRKRRPDEHAPEQSSYYCQHCAGWHLTNVAELRVRVYPDGSHSIMLDRAESGNEVALVPTYAIDAEHEFAVKEVY